MYPPYPPWRGGEGGPPTPLRGGGGGRGGSPPWGGYPPPPGGRPGGLGPEKGNGQNPDFGLFYQSRSPYGSLGDDPLRGTPPSRGLYRGPPTGPIPVPETIIISFHLFLF